MRKRPAGFTLTELLIAIAVATVVGAAVLSILLYSFDIWSGTTARGRRLAAVDSFDLSFSRDFASSCPELGFEGDASSCSFWTYRLAGGSDERLVRVSYAISDKGIEKTAVPYPAGDREPVLSDHFATMAFRGFVFYGTNGVSEAGLPLWEDPSNAPARVSLRLHLPPAPPRERIYRRRTP